MALPTVNLGKEHNSPGEDPHPCIHTTFQILLARDLAMSKSKRRAQRQAGPSAASTSPRNGIPGEDALKFLFDYRPKFTKLAGFEGSFGTRDPAQHDMHMHSQLLLKDIILFPDMLKQLACVVDSKLYFQTRSTRKLPRISSSDDLEPQRYPNLQKLSSLAALTLFAGLDKWSSIFQYDEKPMSMMPCALADGYLSLNKDAIAKAGLPKDLDSDIQLVIEIGFSNFLFWEFKSMNTGSEGVMRAISYLAGSELPWVRCPKSRSCGGRFCKKTNNRFQFTVTGQKTGTDGNILEETSNVKSGVSNRSTLRFDKSNIDFSVSSVPNTSDEVEGDDIEDDGGANDDTVHRLPFNKGDFTKVLKVIQQLVNTDATFMVLNAGSREFIGIRYRKLQRLYLSPFIDLDNPVGPSVSYFKIHTSLQIAALLDAIQLAKRLKALSRLPKLYTPSGSATTPKAAKAEILAHADKDNEDYCPGSEINLTPEEQQLFQQLREAGSLKISWNTYIDRLGPASSMTVTRLDASPPNDSEMEVHIMGQYPKSIHSYYCYADNGQMSIRGIVIKFTRCMHGIVGLRNEYDMYTQLSKIGTIAEGLGTPEHFGLYEHEDHTVLILLDSGDSAPLKFKNRTPNNIYSQVEAAFRKMHFAKITHGDLIPENILGTSKKSRASGTSTLLAGKTVKTTGAYSQHRRLITAILYKDRRGVHGSRRVDASRYPRKVVTAKNNVERTATRRHLRERGHRLGA
ncbi:hypothetical protein DFS33DRAFT_1384965 [Desarmillaria ectypa]|nr:hypothetical protein DFS33DRAFT_1384965 [Desarmillaria ectypa]